MNVWQRLKRNRPKSAKMAELEYSEIGCKKNCILRKTILKFMNLIFGTFRKKLILKHFMRRIIPKMCVLGVFWTAQYVSEVYFTWRRLLTTLLTSFYGYNAFGCICILLTFKKQNKKISVHQLLYFGICSWMVFLLISAKNQETLIIFSIFYKISFAGL